MQSNWEMGQSDLEGQTEQILHEHNLLEEDRVGVIGVRGKEIT